MEITIFLAGIVKPTLVHDPWPNASHLCQAVHTPSPFIICV